MTLMKAIFTSIWWMFHLVSKAIERNSSIREYLVTGEKVSS